MTFKFRKEMYILYYLNLNLIMNIINECKKKKNLNLINESLILGY